MTKQLRYFVMTSSPDAGENGIYVGFEGGQSEMVASWSTIERAGYDLYRLQDSHLNRQHDVACGLSGYNEAVIKLFESLGWELVLDAYSIISFKADTEDPCSIEATYFPPSGAVRVGQLVEDLWQPVEDEYSRYHVPTPTEAEELLRIKADELALDQELDDHDIDKYDGPEY